MGLKVYDIETIAGCFTYTDFDIDTKEVNQFVIHKERNELKAFLDYLKEVIGMIGFNTINFDYPIIHKILLEQDKLLKLKVEDIIYIIYDKAQQIIHEQSNGVIFSQHTIPEYKFLIPQLDLFRVWHYNNKAKSTSLKGLEISMNLENVMDMPIDFRKIDITLEEIDTILDYNLNDVVATYKFYEKTIKYGKLDLRRAIRKKFGLECFNWNNGKIGEQLILKLYCEKTGKDYREVRELRSPVDIIELKDCIPKGIEFKTKLFNSVLDSFKYKVIDKNNFEKKTKEKNRVATILFKGCKIDYGLGGVHGVAKAKLYESTEDKIIKTADVGSLYPNLPIVYEFYIKHLGIEFLEVYKDNIVNVRMEEKKKPKHLQDKAIMDGLKEAANIPYGKSNEINSFLYDPVYTMKTTVAGQLVTSMLVERLGEIPDCELLMFNTDGFEFKIPRQYEKKYLEICYEWEQETKLMLEFGDYEKMWIADVNNYGCISLDGKVKNKGRFEVDKVIGNEPAYYKDNSFRIVPIAIFQYFKYNIPIEETVKNHFTTKYEDFENFGIYDFCGRQKFNRDSHGEIHSVVNHEIVKEKQGKNVRYYISTNGASFIKVYTKGTTEIINKGYHVTIFNKYEKKEFNEYNLDLSFYIKEAYKEIDLINNKGQHEMFD